jgi:Pyruvate/2-oxoacid:ferredoxin oxidoreductase delta subunit
MKTKIMNIQKIYKELNKKLGLADSQFLNDVWKILCTDDEVLIANTLPGSPEDIAQKSGKNINAVSDIINSLYKKGVAFKAMRDGKLKYKLAKNIVQFHDANILWEGATDEFFDAWKKIMDDEFTALIKSLPDNITLPPFMRVVPINDKIDAKSKVLPYEECEHLIETATAVAVVKCPCRLSQKNCDAPIESCITLNRGAEYAIDRGHGRKLTKEQAMDIIKEAEKAGLVHMAEDKGYGNAICNCCSCCCEMLRLIKFSNKKWILSPSRYLVVINKDACTSCGACVEICPADAVVLNSSDITEISSENCLGCGLCTRACPSDAVTLKQIKPENHIPLKEGTGTY